MSRPPIPINDLQAGEAPLHAELVAAVERVLGSGRWLFGPELAAFEAELGAALGDAHCVGVGSGTGALVVALRALGVGAGDEVVTVANTAVPTVSAIREVGATPVFCDVAEATALLDPDAVTACLSRRTRAVVPVHLYGNVVDIERLRARVGGVPIVEDCAQAQGATLRDRPVGTLADAAAFSFYPTKNLGAAGDGGACVTRDPALAKRMRSLRQYGFASPGHAEREGWNTRLDEIQAAILRIKLPHLASAVEARRALMAHYRDGLPERVHGFVSDPGGQPAPHLCVVRVRDRARVRDALEAAGIATAIHYPRPIHRMRAYAFLGQRPGSLPVTERLADEVLTLPLYPELGASDVDRVCAALGEALG